ncbi:Hypothetical predicted protein [Octopus vulgaris]|uniref:Uncharacterized protein n=1 Tax=Octopus vulgaris TaxID=6645 RepID=A0AA36BMX1_OCTVU|nr:Hypothetical predicted protein [Octopus vulgaris]
MKMTSDIIKPNISAIVQLSSFEKSPVDVVVLICGHDGRFELNSMKIGKLADRHTSVSFHLVRSFWVLGSILTGLCRWLSFFWYNTSVILLGYGTGCRMVMLWY